MQEFQVIFYQTHMRELQVIDITSSVINVLSASKIFVKSESTVLLHIFFWRVPIYYQRLIIHCFFNRSFTYIPWIERSIMQAHHLPRLRILSLPWFALNLIHSEDESAFWYLKQYLRLFRPKICRFIVVLKTFVNVCSRMCQSQPETLQNHAHLNLKQLIVRGLLRMSTLSSLLNLDL